MVAWEIITPKGDRVALITDTEIYLYIQDARTTGIKALVEKFGVRDTWEDGNKTKTAIVLQGKPDCAFRIAQEISQSLMMTMRKIEG
jgi:hypothetical protein